MIICIIMYYSQILSHLALAIGSVQTLPIARACKCHDHG